ncbi:hypothetical protein [Pantoea sp. AS-PWVM4]|uniref:hypothetical protein n=1 Tax=Pantoea sp. AS-PWVM4 TaxID=1332069 RepID=UPI00055DDF1E
MFLYDWILSQRIRYQYIFLALLSVLALLGLIMLYKNSPELNSKFFEFHHKNLRGYLFSGFISVGSFLLSLHTFVIVNLKEKVFGTKEYRETFSHATGIDVDSIDEGELFKPLDNLSAFINTSIWLSITTAISQFTLGLSTNFYACLFCVWLAILTIFFMLHSLIIIRDNIKVFLKQKGGK